MPKIAPGMQIAHFRLLEKLGSGSFGEVYKAEDLYLNRLIALKLFTIEHPKASRELFLQEARLSSSLVHPNIVIVYEAGWHESIPFLAMELLEGEVLSRKIRFGDVSYTEALLYMSQILEALEEAHSQGILHRDIKSSNIMITPKGKVKILDFGLATNRQNNSMDADESSMGTMEFLSPERARGEEPDERSDLFSAGVVLYHMLSGRLPFERETRIQTFSAILHDEITPLSHVPDGVNGILQKALAKERTDRYLTARDFLDDLTRLKSHEISHASVASPLTIAVLYFNRNDQSEEIEYLRLGMTEDIITDLSGITGVRVLSRHAIARYRDREVVPRAIAQDLQVRYLLHGSMHKTGDQIEIEVNLFDSQSSSIVWTERHSNRVDQIFDLQEHVAKRVHAALQLRLTESERRSAGQHRTQSFLAYELYLKGRHHYAMQNAEQNKLAEQCLLRCLDLDPMYAAALVALSEVYVQRFYNWFDRERKWLAQAELVILRAAKINDQLAEVHCTLGMLLYLRGEYPQAMEEIRKAIRLDPHYAVAHDHSGEIYLHIGEVDKAILAFHTELRINSEVIYPYFYLVWIHSLLGDFSIARTILEQAKKKHAGSPLLNVLFGTFASYSRELVEAEAYLTRAIAANENNSFAMGRLAVVQSLLGNRNAAFTLAEKATERIDPLDHHAAFDRAAVFCMNGEEQQSFQWLDRAIQLGWRCRYHYENEPNLAGLRQHPHFAALLEKISTQ